MEIAHRAIALLQIMLNRHRLKFQVDFLLADLTDLPLVNASVFAKIRLLNGGKFTATIPS